MNFIEKYFIAPILVEQGYNIFNTIVYALVALGALYLIYNLFEKAKIKIDFKFLLSALPFVFFASTLRALVDYNYIERNFWTVSPGIYLLASGLFLLVFLISYFVIKKQAHRITAIIGFASFLFLFTYMQGAKNLLLFAQIVLLFVSLSLVFYFLFGKLKWKWILDKYGFSVFVAHLFDAVVTVMILYFIGGWEKHPLPRFFIEQFGAFSFIPLKIAVVIPAIWLITKEIEPKQFRNYILIAIAILGLGEGLRNLISLIIY
jgi:uncharacterized membrane protein